MAGESERPCPACGDPVPVGADFCLHCGESLTDDGGSPAAGSGQSGRPTTNVDGTGGRAASGDDTAIAATDTPGEGGGDPVDGATTGTDVDRDAIAAARGDSGSGDLSDSSLVAIIALVAGIVLGMLSFFLYGVLSGDLGVVLLLVVWLAGTGALARRRGVIRSARDGAYALAALLVVVPASVLVLAVATGSDRVGQLTVLVVPMVVAAAIVGGVGYFAGDRLEI